MTTPPRRRIVITVCLLESGRVTLPVTRGGPRRRLGARGITRCLGALVAERGLADCVRIRNGCAGGCGLKGPNVSVAIYPATPPGERPDHVAIAWKTYVATLDQLDALETILDENLA